MATTLGSHLVKAHELYLRWCRDNAVRPSAELAQLVRILASSGQQRTEADDTLGPSENPSVLALTYTDAATALSVSERQVRRLVTEGRLRAVRLGGATRIPKSELDRILDTPPETAA